MSVRPLDELVLTLGCVSAVGMLMIIADAATCPRLSLDRHRMFSAAAAGSAPYFSA